MKAHEPAEDMRGLGANERAIIERIPSAPLRRLAARLVRAKMRVQFTGWLQFLIPVPFVLAALVLAGVANLVGLGWLALPLLVISALGAVIVVFDLVTVKWRIRLPEARPARHDNLDPFDLLRARRSCRSFQTRLMSDADRRELLESVNRQLAVPTIGDTRPRLEYIKAPLVVWPTVNGSEFLVAIVPKQYQRSAVIDVGRTLQRVVVDATRMGLGTCWIGPGADHASVIRHLGDRFDPEADQIICVCAVGYRSRYIPLFIRIFNRQMRHRLPLEQLFFSDLELTRPVDVTSAPYDRYGRTYEACQWSPSSYNGQTTRVALEAAGTEAVTAVRFLATTASRYYAPVALGIWCANWELGCAALGYQGDFTLAPPNEQTDRLPRLDVAWIPHG